ncbi:MAG: 2-amino-4-hydroxy-6-hydroxymethyldihydropteridine diphosphokinase [Chitinophagaceae bacterium]|nr:2-amino-4-hydroxy-6-hydroxymethyldihydropteridine diphosphokinase [Chitinophagaceae bacterium]
MTKVYLLTGGNMGDRAGALQKARELIEAQCGTLTAVSSLYETAAWGKEDQPAFLNQALELQTSLSARQLIRRILKLEKQMGRLREEKYGPRLIDIDILLYGSEIHDYPLLKVPHPELPNRRFALLPLQEIAAALVHPRLQLTITQLLELCPDPLEVKKYS